MSLVSLLSIARSALLTQQRAMDVTGHNIANASTPGYSRQRLALLAATSQWTGFGAIGRGVTDAGVERARDRFLDASYRDAQGGLGRSGMLSDLLGQVEDAFGEPSDTGLGATLDGLFSAFGDLANDPQAGPSRELARQAGGRLATQLRQLASRLDTLGSDAVARLRASVDEANALVGQIAELNVQILAHGGAAGQAADLMDQRDALVDRLSGLIDVKVTPRADGTVAIQGGDALLLDGATARRLEARPLAGGGWGAAIVGGGAVRAGGGTIAAITALTATTLPDVRARLDTLARTLVTEFNAVHRAGYDAAGGTGTDFFDPAGTTASTIGLSSAVAASADAIATSSSAGTSDGRTALALAGLGRTAIASLGGRSLHDYYTEAAGTVGVASRAAGDDFVTQRVLADQADARRSSVQGVSVDEEMISLIAQQQAYGAAARLVGIADEMVQTLLQMI